MSALEIVGFIIAFIVFLFLKSNKVVQRGHTPVELPPDDHEDGEDPLAKLLEAFDRKSLKEKKRKDETQRKKTEQQQSLSNYQQRRISPSESSNQQHRLPPRPVKHQRLPIPVPEEREHHYTITETRLPSRAKEIIRTLSHKQNLLIYQEIMDKPVSLRTKEWQ